MLGAPARLLLKRALTTSASPAVSMAVQQSIETKIRGALEPTHLEIINESYMHNVPKGSETHFKVVCVSEAFGGQTLVKRHRQVFSLLSDELQGPVHALSLHLKTPEEWSKAEGAVSASPACMGGSKR